MLRQAYKQGASFSSSAEPRIQLDLCTLHVLLNIPAWRTLSNVHTVITMNTMITPSC